MQQRQIFVFILQTQFQVIWSSYPLFRESWEFLITNFYCSRVGVPRCPICNYIRKRHPPAFSENRTSCGEPELVALEILQGTNFPVGCKVPSGESLVTWSSVIPIFPYMIANQNNDMNIKSSSNSDYIHIYYQHEVKENF